MKILNKYVLSEKEINLRSNEIGLIILDSKGRLLVEKDKNMINIPLISQNKEYTDNKLIIDQSKRT